MGGAAGWGAPVPGFASLLVPVDPARLHPDAARAELAASWAEAEELQRQLGSSVPRDALTAACRCHSQRVACQRNNAVGLY